MSYLTMVAKTGADPNASPGASVGFREAFSNSTSSISDGDPTVAVTANSLFNPNEPAARRQWIWMATGEQLLDYLEASLVPENAIAEVKSAGGVQLWVF